MSEIDKDLTTVLTIAGIDPTLAGDQLIAMADRLLVNHQGSVRRAADALRPYVLRAAAVTDNAKAMQAAAQSLPAQTFFGRAASGLDGEGAIGNRSSAYLVGSQESVAPPYAPGSPMAADSGLELPMPMEPGDLRSPILNQALGGASEPVPELWVCPYTTPDGCHLENQDIGPCICGAQQ
jgi:hypothetical protein